MARGTAPVPGSLPARSLIRRGRLPRATLVLPFLLLVSACGPDEPLDIRGPTTAVGTAQYFETTDGTRLAVDVYHPAEATGPFPTLLTLTRYRRGLEQASGRPIPTLSDLDRHFLSHGYALVKVDARGSGASFGSRPVEYGRQEVLDGYDVVQWVVSQDWSDGNVGAYGTSYTGTTAELLAAVDHPAVQAVIPGWSDFDAYVSPVRPYGLMARGFIDTWSQLVGAMDRNDREALGAGVRKVDADRRGDLLAEAIEEHTANPDVARMVRETEFRDDTLAAGQTWADIGPLNWKEAIERAATPMLVLVSWMDAGTADGALQRFRTFSNPQNVVVMASNHGGASHASPYTVSDEPLPPLPGVHEQFELRRVFFDHHLKGANNGVSQWPAMRFFNLGEEAFHDTDRWPPAATTSRAFYLDDNGRLSPDSGEPPSEGAEAYPVDTGVTTGNQNRWMTQMGEAVLNLDDRGDMDARMLTYTSAPLTTDMQIAGHPVVSLRLASDREDGSLFVYLEDVDPEGRSRYLTEGGLRLLHRAAGTNPHFETEVPYRTFARSDA
ncbi:MAG: CocE/NonD family hydrolase, partial [Gemmatimonadetes bacterium]|nr:CocE/NonD family hydrolase [Gemmatimonadota bacterium]